MYTDDMVSCYSCKHSDQIRCSAAVYLYSVCGRVTDSHMKENNLGVKDFWAIL